MATENTLDETLHKLYLQGFSDTPTATKQYPNVDKAKQAILHWVATEVIGENESGRHLESPAWNVVGGRNEIRNEQRKILAQHGYKGGE